ncbi:MAG: MFS transporter [Neobacillus sp.]
MKNKIKIILVSFFLSEMGRSLYFIAISWVLYKLTNNALYTGLLVSFGFLPGLFLNLLIGVLVDKFNRKRLTIIANLFSTAAILFILIGVLGEFIHPWLIVTVHMVIQVSGSLYRPSIQAFISEIFQKEELPNVFSKASAAAEVGALLGSSLGGFIIAFYSEIFSILLTVFCFIFSTILIFFIKQGKCPVDHGGKLSIVKDLIGGITYVKTNQMLLGLFAVMFVGQLVFHTSMGFLAVYTNEHLNQSAKVYGLLDATIAFGGITAGILGTWWWKLNRNAIAIRSLFIILVGLFILSFFRMVPFTVIGIFLIGLGTTWIRILFQSIQQMVTDANFHGRMASLRMMCNQASVVIGGPIIGLIATKHGINIGYLVLTIPVCICLIFAVFQSRIKAFKKITEITA